MILRNLNSRGISKRETILTSRDRPVTGVVWTPLHGVVRTLLIDHIVKSYHYEVEKECRTSLWSKEFDDPYGKKGS